MFRSLARFFKTLFGLAEGGTERATDALLVSSPDAIRNQFRKTREDMARDYEEMKEAVGELYNVRQMKFKELQLCVNQLTNAEKVMEGSITEYKRSQNEACKLAYGEAAAEKEHLEAEKARLSDEMAQQSATLATYMEKLAAFESEMVKLQQEEAATVADIVSARKMEELNAKLSHMSTDTASKNLAAIREAREKLTAKAQVTAQLAAPTKVQQVHAQMLEAGTKSKHMAAFEEATKLDRLIPATKEEEKPRATKSLDTLFS